MQGLYGSTIQSIVTYQDPPDLLQPMRRVLKARAKSPKKGKPVSKSFTKLNMFQKTYTQALTRVNRSRLDQKRKKQSKKKIFTKPKRFQARPLPRFLQEMISKKPKRRVIDLKAVP